MYCPNCAAENPANGKFCRKCGTDISFVTNALAGTTSSPRVAPVNQHPRSAQQVTATDDMLARPARIYRAIRDCFLGVGFILASAGVFRFAPAGKIWWFWLLIPAFGAFGNAAAEFFRYRNEQRLLQRRETYIGDAPPPPSITEGTTRALNVPNKH